MGPKGENQRIPGPAPSLNGKTPTPSFVMMDLGLRGSVLSIDLQVLFLHLSNPFPTSKKRAPISPISREMGKISSVLKTTIFFEPIGSPLVSRGPAVPYSKPRTVWILPT